MAEYDPLVRPPSVAAPTLDSILNAAKFAEGLPGVFRQAQVDQAKVNALNQLKNIQLIDPNTGQVNPAAYNLIAQAQLSGGQAGGAIDALQAGQQQQDITAAQGVGARYFGGGGPGPQSSAAPAGWSGTTSSASDPRGLVPYIRETAQKYGISPDVAVRVAQSEGLTDPVGDRGTSFGAFQVHMAPGAVGSDFKRDTGLDPRDPANEKATIDYALRRAAQGGWGPWMGAAKVGVGQWTGIARSQRKPQGNTVSDLVNDVWKGDSNLGRIVAGNIGRALNIGPDDPLSKDKKEIAQRYVENYARRKSDIAPPAPTVATPRPGQAPTASPGQAPAQPEAPRVGDRVAGAGDAPPASTALAEPLTEEALRRSATRGTPNERVEQGFEAVETPPSAGAVSPRVAGPATPTAQTATAGPAGGPAAGQPLPQAPAPAQPGAPPQGPELVHPRPLPPGYTRWQDAVDDMRRDGNRLELSRSPQAQRMGSQLLKQADEIEKTHAPMEVMPGRPIYNPETRQYTMTPQAPGGRGSGGVQGQLLQDYRREHPNATAEEEQAFLNSGRAAGRSAIGQYMQKWSLEHPNASADQYKLAQQTYQRQLTAQNRFFSGPAGNTIRSLDVVVSHIGVLDDMTSALKNGHVQLFNDIAARWAEATGKPAPTNFKLAAQIVGTEIMKGLTNAGVGTGAERAELSGAFRVAESPEQLRGAMDTARRLLGGQLNGLRRQFKQSTGLKDDDFDQLLSPENIQWYEGKDQTSQPPDYSRAGVTGRPRAGGDQGGGAPSGGATGRIVRSKDEYDKLPSGTEFVGDDGKRYKKP